MARRSHKTPLRIENTSPDRSQGETSLTYLFPKEKSYTEGAPAVPTKTEQPDEYDEKEYNVSDDEDDDAKFAAVRVGNYALLRNGVPV